MGKDQEKAVKKVAKDGEKGAKKTGGGGGFNRLQLVKYLNQGAQAPAPKGGVQQAVTDAKLGK
jgi:hypothetical protein